MNNKRKIFINSIIVLFSTLLDKGGFFLINVIVARYLSKQDFGEYTTALAYATFFSTFADIGINSSLKRAINLESDKENEHISNAILVKSILCITVYLILCLSLFFTNYNRTTVLLSLIFGLVRMGTTYNSIFYAIYEAKERFFISTRIQNAFSISLLIITFIVAFIHAENFYFAYTRLALVILFIAILFPMIIREFKFKYNLQLLKDFFTQSVYFSLSNIIRNSYLRINILILSFIQGTIYSGIFQNGFYFFTSLSFIPINFATVILPYLYKTDIKTGRKEYQFAFDICTKILAIISFFIFIIFFLFSEEIVTLVYGKKYIASASILRITSLAIPFLFDQSGTLITALDLQKYRTKIQAVALAINIISNLILIYLFKAEGAAMSVIITYAYLQITYRIFLKRKMGIQVRNIFIIQLKLCIMVISIALLYKYYLHMVIPVVSILIVSTIYVLSVFIFLIRKDDIRIVKEIRHGRTKKIKRQTD